MIKRIFFTLLLFFCAFLHSDEATWVTLSGFLSQELLEEANSTLSGPIQNNTLVLEINSATGDLEKTLDLAKRIYQLKIQRNAKVIIYIDDKAVGPSAVLPFLADELYASYVVSWGDISIGGEDTVPTNLLRSQVSSLVSSKNRNVQLLRLLASAMTDSSVRIIDQNGWHRGELGQGEVISDIGEFLVVNQNQLQELGLVDGLIAIEEFRTRFEPKQRISSSVEGSPIPSKGVDQRLQAAIKYSDELPNKIGLISIDKIDSAINQATWIYVKNALDYYKKNKPAFIILELNTPGGEVFSAQKISDALKEMDTQYGVPVVTFINNWAISAGAMLAYSTRFITLAKDASMGAAEPVLPSQEGGMQTASEKINSALRTDFANRAGFFDRNRDIAEAMVDKDIILVWRNNRIVRLDDPEQIRSRGPNQDEIITSKGKLLTLNAEDLMKYGVADLLLSPVKMDLITEQERNEGSWSASKMLLFHYPFFEKIPNATIDEYQMDWKTRFFTLLAHPMVASLLFLGMMLGFYTEINSPGFGLPGSVGVICLVLIMLSSFALDIANVLEVILLLAGIVLIALDLFLIPTFGLLGIAGVVLFLMGLFGMMLPGIENIDFEMDTQTFNAAGEAFFQKLAWLSGTLVLGVILMFVMARYLTPNLATFGRLVLKGEQEGYKSGADPKTLPQPGSVGEVFATLRPAGKVSIENRIYDAVTSGDFIEKGTPIVVKSLDGSVIVVDKE